MTIPSPVVATQARRALVALLGGALLVGAFLGAWVDWHYWMTYTGAATVFSLAAGLVLLFGAVWALGARSRRRMRVFGLTLVALSLGGFLGQAIGPSREPTFSSTGTMTLRLTSPTVATATGPARCTTVASGSDLLVSGGDRDLAMRLDSTEAPYVSIAFSQGDRWHAFHPSSRNDGLVLRIRLVPDSARDAGMAVDAAMAAGPSSTLALSETNGSGSLAFSGLVPVVGSDLTGEPIALVGTFEWTCGPTT